MVLDPRELIDNYIINCSPDLITINFGQKLVQFVVRKVEYESVEVVEEFELEEIFSMRNSERKDGALGSTN